jgi:hypothetical protein
MKLAHSYSSIKLFENCPLRYYRQRIKKDVVDEGGEASKHGERIHAFLEKRLKGSDLDPEVAKYEPLCAAVERAAKDGELCIEQELVLTERLVPTGWWEPDAWLRSKLDVLIIAGADAVVMDWKTGKRNPDFFQMELFAAQVFKHYPEVQRVKTSLVWLKTLEMDTETYTRLNIQRRSGPGSCSASSASTMRTTARCGRPVPPACASSALRGMTANTLDTHVK